MTLVCDKQAYQKKQTLLEMAHKGEPRPHSRNHPLGKVFSHYISKTSKAYDPDFVQEIRRVRPDWFTQKTSNQNKEIILQLARNGAAKPSRRKHPLGEALNAYTRTSSGSFDMEFDEKIRELRPDWFVKKHESKQQILKIAEGGKLKLQGNLVKILNYYTKTYSKGYCVDFYQKIYSLRPDWFIDPVEENKKVLLQMARDGKARPKQYTKIGSALSRYTKISSKCYDSKFVKEISEIAPYWFSQISRVSQLV